MAKKTSSKPKKDSAKTVEATKSKKERREELKKSSMSKKIKDKLPLIIGVGIFLIIAFLAISQSTQNEVILGNNSSDSVEMVYFHLPTCPHCIEQNKFNLKLVEAYPNLKIVKYNMELQSSREKLNEYIEKIPALQNERIGTPLTIVGEQYNIGFGTAETTGLKISKMIDEEIKKQKEVTNTSN